MSCRHRITKAMLSTYILGRALLFATALIDLVAVSPTAMGQPLTNPATALEDYVNAPDSTYNFQVISVQKAPRFTQYTVRMQSQTWNPQDQIFTPGDFISTPTRPNPTIWEHGLAIIVPDNLQHDTGALLIAGGSNDGEPVGAEEVQAAILFALHTESVAAALFQVPNQPLQFVDEPFNHTEDELVAYSWDKAMDAEVMGTPDYSWPAYLPMVKSAVRAMDTVEALVPSVTRFVVTGFSKRGAATWLTAVVDDHRVRAIAPGVYDSLNFSPQAAHHLATYGCISRALEDYINYEIIQRLDTFEGEALRQVVDPYSYRHRLMLPKFLLNASGDQFYTPDSARFYWNDLLDEKHLRYVPNADHGFDTSAALANALENLLAWYRTVLFEIPRPAVSWSLRDTGALVVTTSPPARFARLWRATNPEARDFRLQTIGEAWTSTRLLSIGNGKFVARVPQPASGWTAYFVEVIYFGGLPQFYTTQVFITPDDLPFPNVPVTVCPE